MAIDLGAIEQAYSSAIAQGKDKADVRIENLEKFYNEKEAHQKKLLALEAANVDSVIGTLNYKSDSSEFANAEKSNLEWLENANDVSRTKQDKQLNQAIYENKQNLIDKLGGDVLKYDSLDISPASTSCLP